MREAVGSWRWMISPMTRISNATQKHWHNWQFSKYNARRGQRV